MLFELTTTKTLAELDRDLREAAARHRFGVITTHNLKEAMAAKGVEFDGECVIYEVCNPHQAKKVLEENGAVSAVLPCRIAVYKKGESYRLVTIRPTALMQMFDVPSLAPAAHEVEQELVTIMQEAASSSA